MIRGRALAHPYVSIGSIKRAVKIYPDYLLYARDELTWVLDAKSPRESVDDAEHLSQAYTYAVHRDVRVNWYGLCNGREIVIHHVADMGAVPRLRVPLCDIEKHWNDLKALLLPPAIGSHGKSFAKDFGIHLLKLGIERRAELVFPCVMLPMISRYESRYTICVNAKIDGVEYAATYDFGLDACQQLLSLIAEPDRRRIKNALSEEVVILHLLNTNIEVGIRARLTRHILENDHEHFLPLEVLEFFV